MIELTDVRDSKPPAFEEVKAQVMEQLMEQKLQAYQAVDFDDLIGLPVKILTEHEPARERWQNRFRYVLVDEVQDTNATQYALLRHIVGARALFTAVGDDDQAIYGWRGATVENLADLERDYPQLKVIKLEQNYRSTNTRNNSRACHHGEACSNPTYRCDSQIGRAHV